MPRLGRHPSMEEAPEPLKPRTLQLNQRIDQLTHFFLGSQNDPERIRQLPTESGRRSIDQAVGMMP